MLYGDNRDELRRIYVRAWQKRLSPQDAEPLEQQLIAIIAMHPEYHALLEDEGRALGWEPSGSEGESNPFLHMGMHMAIHEQLATNRPAGLQQAHQQLQARCGDTHQADHAVMECLGQTLWEAQSRGTAPDETAYLACVQKIAAG